MDQPSSRPVPEGESPKVPPWKAILGAGSPRAVLARIVDGDPLDLRGRCELRLRSQAVLLDLNRVHLRCAAHVARHAAAFSGQPPIDVWLAERVRKATQEILHENAEAAASGAIPMPPDDERLRLVADTFGIDPAQIGLACVAFNRQAYEARAAFHGLILDACEPKAWCAENSTTIDRAMGALRSALWALGVREGLDLDELLRGGDDDA